MNTIRKKMLTSNSSSLEDSDCLLFSSKVCLKTLLPKEQDKR